MELPQLQALVDNETGLVDSVWFRCRVAMDPIGLAR